MAKTRISPTTISKMVKGEAVSLVVIGKICRELDSDIGNIITIEKFNLEDN
ncbi:MAG: helix-turn-helix transcriptional regulator [Streptococcus mitis]|uniref:Helix-turn-helix domain-containing protein n=1 Tax=Streptococcus mitis TaxID=28037 RepID=A0A6I1TTJ6_STRMT|nr:helix-turn-helix transcriptional regulator [Streptococcus mitis]MDU2559616.1 helix-turn-helix transcriptional regulator [Streptococcus mitis]MQQ29222.1 helix-turn-helix domain-containing protein [Streptococcus mitis]